MSVVDKVSPEIMDKIGARFGGLPAVEETHANRAPQEDEGAIEATEQVEGEVEAVDDGFADLDWEGQTLKVPTGLKDALMRTDDYTRKTQELAEHRRAVDQMREVAQAQQIETEFSRSIAGESQQLSVIDAYLQQASKVNWSEMSAEQMLRHRLDMDQIKDQRQQLQQSIDGKRSKFTNDMQARIKELRGKSREAASKSIQGFTEETEKTMREFAKSEGLGDTEIDNVLLDPRSVKIIWKAMQFDKVKAGTAKAGEQAQRADRVLKPGAAGNKMPAETANKLNFNKAMNKATTSSEKARLIEQRLGGMFSKGKR